MINKEKIKIFLKLLKNPLINKHKFKFTLFLIKNYLKKYLNKYFEVSFYWVNNSKILINKDEYFLNNELRYGLSEFHDMIFLLHVLKKKHIFIDCGAHFGLYAILASKVIGSKSFTFEPNPKAVLRQKKHFVLNNINHLVKIKKKALGRKLKNVSLVVNSDEKLSVQNFVLDNISYNSKKKGDQLLDFINKNKIIKVSQTSLDYEMKKILKLKEYVIKIDIQGSEYDCILGAEKILKNEGLLALIIENAHDSRYELKTSREKTYKKLINYKLYPIKYDPFKKEIKKIDISKCFNNRNIIFIRNFNQVQNLCNESKKFLIRPIGNVEI